MTADPTDVVLVAGARTPFGRFRGALAQLTAVELGVVAARAALERAGGLAAAVDSVIIGQVLQAGAGQGWHRAAHERSRTTWEHTDFRSPRVDTREPCARTDGAARQGSTGSGCATAVAR